METKGKKDEVKNKKNMWRIITIAIGSVFLLAFFFIWKFVDKGGNIGIWSIICLAISVLAFLACFVFFSRDKGDFVERK